jgi:hypothetical protein
MTRQIVRVRIVATMPQDTHGIPERVWAQALGTTADLRPALWGGGGYVVTAGHPLEGFGLKAEHFTPWTEGWVFDLESADGAEL